MGYERYNSVQRQERDEMTKGIPYQKNDQGQNTLETPKQARTITPEEEDFLNDPNARRIKNNESIKLTET
ncbi:unnamed protein product [Didymodactylos carnosus]|uniref:Uncharacterized protein n=1 Tax=Didymodactylos carnosus TaxID=1234261 RepID=A0A8S2EPA3_9BILA|nr:unnamed protein product [Didymodactylos carnosus]CAF4010343.1 unnamed protein product [Didymodactylos carnosus]